MARILKISLVYFLFLGMKPVHAQANYLLSQFTDYIDYLQQSCDYNRQLTADFFSQLGSEARATCSVLRKDIERSSSIMQPVDTQLKCHQQTRLSESQCLYRQARCVEKFRSLLSSIENCREKIRIDTMGDLKLKKYYTK